MRTIGSLAEADLGRTVTIHHGAQTTSGVLAEVRHHRGATSGRRVTTLTLAYTSPTGVSAVQNHHGGVARGEKITLPDDSGTLCEVTS